MKVEKDFSLKIAEVGFSIGSIGPLRSIIRPIESNWMYAYYENMLVTSLEGVEDQEKYKSFTETFVGTSEINGFSARYNRKIEIATILEGEREVILSTIDDTPLTHTIGLSFLRLTIKDRHIGAVEFYAEKILKSKIQGSVNPSYHEVPKMNKWYFLKLVTDELSDFELSKTQQRPNLI